MNSAATTEHSAEQPAVSSGSAAEWTISASFDQVEVPRNKKTHVTRRVPLHSQSMRGSWESIMGGDSIWPTENLKYVIRFQKDL